MEELGSGMHPVLINQYPLSLNHSILLLFAEEGLPQILSDEILALLFQIFRISKNENMRIGYNSMGAECWINNLHFHLVSTDHLFTPDITPINAFPIERAKTSVFLESTLKHNDENEINMFTVGVTFALTEDWPIPAFVIKPKPSESPANEHMSDIEALEGTDPTESVAHAVGVLLNILIDKNIPHNLMIADRGETVFVIP